MAIEKFITPDVLFDPTPSYDYMWYFDIINLFNLATKVDGKKTKFHDFYKETFITPLVNTFKTNKFITYPMAMISKPNENKVGRKLVYSKYHFFNGLLSELYQQIDMVNENPEEYNKKLKEIFKNNIDKNSSELNEVFANLFKEKCRRYQDLLTREIESEYFDAASKDYRDLKTDLDFRTYVKKAYEENNNIYKGLLTLGDFFENALDYHKLAACFDADTFYLMFAKIVYEFNLMREEQEKTSDNSYIYLFNYEEAVKMVVKENRKYDPRIIYILDNGKRIHYSRWLFEDEFQKMQKRNPQIKPFEIPGINTQNKDKYRDISIMEKIHQILTGDTFESNWELLPKGEGLKKSEVALKSYQNRLKNREKDLATLRYETDERIKIIERSGYLTYIKGKNTFNGYYAFIYGTGAVVLEKFWNDEETLIPAKEEATFIMNIDNFMEMSKLSKLQLIEYIKTLSNSGVMRKYHTSINNWQSNIYKAINGESYELEDVIRFIDRLMRDNEERERTNE